MARAGNTNENGYGEIRVGLWLSGSALPLIAIYLHTKFYLNANSSFEVICWTRYQMDGRMDGRTDVRQSGHYMLPPLGSIIKGRN